MGGTVPCARVPDGLKKELSDTFLSLLPDSGYEGTSCPVLSALGLLHHDGLYSLWTEINQIFLELLLSQPGEKQLTHLPFLKRDPI